MRKEIREFLTAAVICGVVALAASLAAATPREARRAEAKLLRGLGMRSLPPGCQIVVLDETKPATDPRNLGVDCAVLPLTLGSWGSWGS